MSDPRPLRFDLTIDGDEEDISGAPTTRSVDIAALPDRATDAIAHLQRLNPAELEQVGIAPQEVLRALTLVTEVRRLDSALPAAQALASRLEQSRLDRAHQIAKLLGDMAMQARHSVECDPRNAEIAGPLSSLLESAAGPSTKAPSTRSPATRRTARGPKADDAPLSIHL